MGGRERIYSARIAERQGGDLGNSRRGREAARCAGWVRTRRPGVWCLRSAVTMGLKLLLKRGENERWERKKKGKKEKRKNKNHVCIMAAPKGNGFAANVNDPMAAGGMATTDVTQASEQAKTREFLTKHRFKDPEDGCHIYIYIYIYMYIYMYICIYIYTYIGIPYCLLPIW